jgi:hypothetical protein
MLFPVITRLLMTSGLPLLLPPITLHLLGDAHAQSVAYALGICGWLGLVGMGAHTPLLRAIQLAPQGMGRQQTLGAVMRFASTQSLIMLVALLIWTSVQYTVRGVWTVDKAAWVLMLGCVWATFPLTNTVLAQWYALGQFARGDVSVLLQRMAVVCTLVLFAQNAANGWGLWPLMLAMVTTAWLGLWVLLKRLRRLEPEILRLTSMARSKATPTTAVQLWKESSHYLIWAVMMACYGPLPVLWTSALYPSDTLVLSMSITFSGLLGMYIGAATVPWMNEVQSHVGAPGYVQQHQRRLWRALLQAMLILQAALWLTSSWHELWVGPQQAERFRQFTSVLILAQMGRLFSLATSQCAAAMKRERVVHPAVFVEVITGLALMTLWADWPHGEGFVAALASAFSVRALMTWFFETRWINRYWHDTNSASQALLATNKETS